MIEFFWQQALQCQYGHGSLRSLFHLEFFHFQEESSDLKLLKDEDLLAEKWFLSFFMIAYRPAHPDWFTSICRTFACSNLPWAEISIPGAGFIGSISLSFTDLCNLQGSQELQGRSGLGRQLIPSFTMSQSFQIHLSSHFVLTLSFSPKIGLNL